MSKKGITGHDEWVVTELLATALIALEQLDPKHQPSKHMDDIRKLMVAGCQPGTVNLHLAQAKCRLFPGADRAASIGNMGSRTPRSDPGAARPPPPNSRAIALWGEVIEGDARLSGRAAVRLFYISTSSFNLLSSAP